jgi:mono/diheme cytochrome c family protein
MLARPDFPCGRYNPIHELRTLLAICAVTFGLVSTSAQAADPSATDLEFFEKQVRPLLVDYCLQCHSEAKKIKGGLRLDTADGWIKGGDSGPALVSGKPDESLLIQAIRYEHDDVQMPPKGKLSDSQIEAFAEWVRRGAPAPKDAPKAGATRIATLDLEAGRAFWAYRPLTTPTIPDVSSASDHPIDRFVAAKLTTAGLTPSERASRAVLVRRLYFDLHGLPPTPQEVDAFVSDDSPTAWEQLVDRLLASPRFGERFGRHWLDIVRYAESLTLRGFIFPEAWRYRDYVVESFHVDRPFDRFLMEQVAGDLMPASNLDERRRQLVATTFLALGNTNLEEQDKRQLDMDVVDEQLDTLGKAFLGQTIGCARCHDHKFDPIPTRDYYALAGILRSSQLLEHSNVSAWKTVPLPQEREVDQRYATLDADAKTLQSRLDSLKKEIAKLDDAQTAKDKGPAILPVKDISGVVVDDTQAKRVGVWQDSQFSKRYIGDGYVHDKNDAKGEKTLTFLPNLPANGKYEVRFSWTPGENRADNVPVVVFSADGEKTVTVNQQLAPPVEGRWLSLGTFQFETSGQSFVIVSNEGTKGHVVADAVQFLPIGADLKPIVDAREPEELLAKRAELKEVDARLKQARDELARRPRVMTVVERSEIADCAIHVRGSVHTQGEVVPRGFLQVVSWESPVLSKDQSGRLQLGEWLASPKNPLPSRVYVNRVWHWLFGVGLVRTVDNFGLTGEVPSHLELLDHLASQFVADGWSVKKLVRRIVLSQTYQQASTERVDALAADPENRLLWRMNRKRLEAECLRDNMLHIAGRLTLEAPQASTIRPNTTSDFTYTDDSTRRSLYVPAFRNALPDLFEAFDFADPSLVVGRRNVSTVAPQALFLMNSPFVREQARAAALRVVAGKFFVVDNEASPKLAENVDQSPLPPEDERWISRAFEATLGRAPSAVERQRVRAYLEPAVGGSTEEQEQAWTDVFQVLFATVDFRYRD